MTKREAKRTACKIANALLEGYRDAGQPWEDLVDECATDDEIENANRLHAAICELQNEMLRRAGEGYPAEHTKQSREDLING